jgi:hypothetical protein
MVVKDTLKSTYVLPYNHPLLPTIFSIDHKHLHAKVRAFHQHVQLLNKNSYAVRATAQVDDGAMRNCIGHHIWHSYGHCLRELKPSVTQISVASGHEVPCDGTWSGEVWIGGTTSFTHFEVFDCGYAFNIILGKPWLQEVRAIHNYATDTIRIPMELSHTTITNTLETEQDVVMAERIPILDIHPSLVSPYDTNTMEPHRSLDDLISDEMQRIEHLHKEEGRWAESRWACYLDVELTNEDDEPELKNHPTGVQWFMTKAEQRQIVRAMRHEWRHDSPFSDIPCC